MLPGCKSDSTTKVEVDVDPVGCLYPARRTMYWGHNSLLFRMAPLGVCLFIRTVPGLVSWTGSNAVVH